MCKLFFHYVPPLSMIRIKKGQYYPIIWWELEKRAMFFRLHMKWTVQFSSQRLYLNKYDVMYCTYLSRWWHTISMSKCSSIVLAVYGLVGLVEDGSTFFSAHTQIISGAWPPPAPSEWYVCIVLPLNASMDCSTHDDSFNVSVWMVTYNNIITDMSNIMKCKLQMNYFFY